MLVLASAFLAKLSHPVVLAVLMGAAVGGSMCTRARVALARVYHRVTVQ